jgi:hypothetical protein
MKHYNSINNGYNIRGAGSRGKHSEETKQRISQSNTGKTRPNLKGQHLSEEHRKHISESHRGKNRPPFTEEHKQKISIANRGRMVPSRPCSEETRQKLRKPHAFFSQETRQKMHLAQVQRREKEKLDKVLS